MNIKIKSVEQEKKVLEILEKKGFVWTSGAKPTEKHFYDSDREEKYYLKLIFSTKVVFGEWCNKNHGVSAEDFIELLEDEQKTENEKSKSYAFGYPTKPKFENENVDHPAHYQGKNECIDVMIALFGIEAVKAFCKCNAYKYRFRADKKNGEEDIQKAEWYESKLIELERVGA